MPSAGSDRAAPPSNDQVEVSLFGPGYGESVLVHLGNDTWIIVDSCIDSTHNRIPAPLAYLRHIGVDVARSVVLVIATHWHDDHVRGLGNIVAACSAARFVCSDALKSQDFLTLVCKCAEASTKSTSGVNEFDKILNELRRRSSTPLFAIQDRTILAGTSGTHNWLVQSLSPSDYACVLSAVEISEMIPNTGPRIRVPSLHPNHSAVVISITVGHYVLLLGSDLEEKEDKSTGWSCIIANSNLNTQPAHVFKIPHHGSVTAHNQDVWSTMLRPNPISVLTPFVRGNTILPTGTDVSRISRATSEAYITASPLQRRPTRRISAAERVINMVVKNRRQVLCSSGHIRCRMSLSSPVMHPTIELFNGAYHLEHPSVERT